MTTHRSYFRMRQPADYGSELYPEDIRQLPDRKIREGLPFCFFSICRSHGVDGQQSLYDQFGTYLVQNGLYIASQFSADSYAGALANQTNLAVKVCLSLSASNLADPPNLRSWSHLSPSLRSGLHLKSSKSSEIRTRVNSITYVALSSDITGM